MVEIKVQAPDSATAMEEVEKQLGSDALIIATNKVDGKIEIVATNDEPANYQKRSEPLILDNDYRVKNFSDVLVPKIEESRENETNEKNEFGHSVLNESIQSIKAELRKLEKLSAEEIQTERVLERETISNLFQFSGVSKNVIELLNKNTSEKSLEQMAKSLSKMFVSGKCPNFEASDLFLIVGPRLSGKSVFAKKLMALIESKEEIKDCSDIDCENLKSAVAKISSWASKNEGSASTSRKIAISELSDDIEVDRLLLEIHKQSPKLNISVIKVCAAGNSYQYLRRNFPKRSMDNEYLAITKLDLCDLSLSEISAFIELNHKCMFFSGIETDADGIFFAQVEKVMSHIVKTVGSEELE
jgi:flagellar biosynthesis GTPase FlhF